MKIISGNEAQLKLKAGVDKLALAVGSTLGVAGRNVIIGKEYPIVTNDGVTIAKYLKLDDPVERKGADVVKQAALSTNLEAGDGTTTATVLAHAIYTNALEKNLNPMELRVGLKASLEEAVKLLKEKSQKVTDLEPVATVSVGGDGALGKIVADAIKKAGRKGHVSVDAGTESGVKIAVTKGVKQNGGIVLYQMLGRSNKLELKDAPVIVSSTKITSIYSMASILRSLKEKNLQEVVILAPGFSEEVQSLLLVNAQKGIITGIAAKVDEPEKVAEALNVPAMTDETVDGHVATAKKIMIDNEKTVVMTESNSGNDVIAVIQVSLATDAEQRETIMRLDDAVNAVRAAQENGVVRGGGLALSDVADKLDTSTVAGEILAQSMRAPSKKIRENGLKGEISSDIVDPTKVVESALRNAVSASTILLTTEVVIYEDDQEPKQAA